MIWQATLIEHNILCRHVIKTIVTSDKASLDKHNKEACKFCDGRFCTIEELSQHADTHHKFRCEICEKGFDNKYEMETHENTIHGKHKIHCSICHSEQKSNEELTNHMETDHTLRCDVCNPNYTNKEDLDEHVTSRSSVIIAITNYRIKVAWKPMNLNYIRTNASIVKQSWLPEKPWMNISKKLIIFCAFLATFHSPFH